MQSITVKRYAAASHGFAGWMEPADRSWIAFIDVDGRPRFFLDRDPSGAVVEPLAAPQAETA